MPPKSLLLLPLALLLNACGDSSSNGTATASPAGATLSPLEKEARDTALATLKKHWAQTPNGWTTALWEGTSFAPVTFLRQMKDFTIDRVDENPLSQADKMNGIEWAGDIWLDKTPTREAGEQGVILGGNSGIIMRRPGAWSQWVDYTPQPLQVQKIKGQWQVRDDNTLVTGKIPTPADFAKAGVK